jgi:hypothetical protein
MKRMWIFCVLLVGLVVACENKPASQPAKSEGLPVPKVMIEKGTAEKEPPLPPEVKIKLKKDGKDNYSWELSGSDVDQILKVNEKLQKKLGGQPSR